MRRSDRWHGRLRLASTPGAIVFALATAVPAAGQAATLASAVRACLDATGTAGIDDAGLRGGGWEAYDIDVGDDAAPLRVYGRGRGPMLLAGVGAESAESGCHVLQPLSAGTALAAAVTELTAELRTEPNERKASQAMWVIGGKGVLLEATTKNAKPAVHVTVVNIAEGTK